MVADIEWRAFGSVRVLASLQPGRRSAGSGLAHRSLLGVLWSSTSGFWDQAARLGPFSGQHGAARSLKSELESWLLRLSRYTEGFSVALRVIGIRRSYER